jgi:uroporphyrinogen-III decarboxylase
MGIKKVKMTYLDTITSLLDELNRLCDSDENKRRLALWELDQCGIRGETQWHAVPSYTVDSNQPMPVTAECLVTIWQELLGLDLKKYYTDPVYFIENFLKIRIRKFKELSDDTPLTRDIPVSFGVTHEAGILGQEYHFHYDEEPTFAKHSIVNADTTFPDQIVFNNNGYLKMVIPYYDRVKEIAGPEFNIVFPYWFRGPQGVALYIRGYENFMLDMYLDEAFVHRLLRYVTNAAKQYAQWCSDYLGKPIPKGDLFNDDIPIMSPEMYERFFLPYEQELSDFYGGIHYWHSCGDVTKHVAAVHNLTNISIFDFGVTMKDKLAGLKGLNREQSVEFRVFAQPYIQECTEQESKDYILKLLADCRDERIKKYVIRTSGMSVLLGAQTDFNKLSRWVEIVREAQEISG